MTAFSEELEVLVDRNTLCAVIEALAEIASEKADHLRANWQDEQTAKYWDRASRRLSDIATSKAIALI